tara:strand:+ start:984 stop:1835 length:852 start_codon:yes stop_codon:yes gene_type:complete
MNIELIGVGLIGSSMILDLRKNFDLNVIGHDLNSDNLKYALKNGIIDQVGKSKKFINSDIVFLATPVDVSLKLLPEILSIIGKNTLVIDFGSTKEKICKAVQYHSNRDLYLATHPIAGNEFSGSKHALNSLFKDKIQILCEKNKTRKDLLKIAEKLFISLEMKIKEMTPKIHDKHMAIVSHLSHISSFMLGKTVLDKKSKIDILDLAGSGFESTVRLAKSSPDMWTPIFSQNKSNILKILDDYIKNLIDFKTELLNDNFSQIKNQIKYTNELKSVLDNITKKK